MSDRHPLDTPTSLAPDPDRLFRRAPGRGGQRDAMTSERTLRTGLQRITRRLEAIAPFVLAGTLLLGASELVWRWGTWKVRQLLELARGAMP